MASGRDPTGPRKGFSPDSRGIHWGIGKHHESGKPWEPGEWERFVAWALENGAREGVQCVNWCEKERFHRPDGPAIIWRDGAESWWLNGKLHRPDGPAIVCYDGSKKWHLNGQRHRPDGPAVLCPDGYVEWWLDNIQYTDETFNVEFGTV